MPLGLGLMLWEGESEGKHDLWLRWCKAAEIAAAERRRAEKLAQRLKGLGIEPEE